MCTHVGGVGGGGGRGNAPVQTACTIGRPRQMARSECRVGPAVTQQSTGRPGGRHVDRCAQPTSSPGRGDRVVCDTLKPKCPVPSISLRMSVPLPTPDGPTITSALGRCIGVPGSGSGSGAAAATAGSGGGGGGGSATGCCGCGGGDGGGGGCVAGAAGVGAGAPAPAAACVDCSAPMLANTQVADDGVMMMMVRSTTPVHAPWQGAARSLARSAAQINVSAATDDWRCCSAGKSSTGVELEGRVHSLPLGSLQAASDDVYVHTLSESIAGMSHDEMMMGTIALNACVPP